MLSGMHPCVIEVVTEVPFGTITEDDVAELLEGHSVKVSAGMVVLIYRKTWDDALSLMCGRRCYLGYVPVSEAARRAARFTLVFEAKAVSAISASLRATCSSVLPASAGAGLSSTCLLPCHAGSPG